MEMGLAWKGVGSGAHLISIQVAMRLRISVSLSSVSSKPGVSTSLTRWPFHSKAPAWICFVHDSLVWPTSAMFWPEAAFKNWLMPFRRVLGHANGMDVRYSCPSPWLPSLR